MLFWRKTDEKIWNSPFVRDPPPPLSTNPLSLSSFFTTPLFVQILKTRNPPSNFFRGWENYDHGKRGLVPGLKFPIHYTCVVFQTLQNIFKWEKVKKQQRIIGILISIPENLNALTVLFIFIWISYGKSIVKPDFFSNICLSSLFICHVFYSGWDVFYITILRSQILFLLNIYKAKNSSWNVY